ncbi:helix-turn-helix domain-containing protein [Paractinoplanes durhamensis]
MLARWRKARKMTGQALGDRVGMSQAKISRLETGAVTAEPADVRLIGEKLGIPATEVIQAVALAERGQERLTDWTTARPRLVERQQEVGRVEMQAREIRVFQPAVVPGLTQTSEYARAVLFALKDLYDPHNSDSPLAVSEAVNARMKRSEILFLPDHKFYFLITEQVLRNRVCEPAAMVAQIARVRELANCQNVDFRILPDTAELPVAPYHGFSIIDDRQISVDLLNTMVWSNGRKTIQDYRRVFDALLSVASTDINDLLNAYQARYARMLLPESMAG